MVLPFTVVLFTLRPYHFFMKIVVTGAPGTGKTTLVKRLFRLYPERFKGFWTEEIREKGRRTGFRIVRTDGKMGILSRIDIERPYRVGKYRVNVDEFEKLVIPFLVPDERIILIDEIGKMELFSKRFVEIVEELLFGETSVIATIPLKDVHPVVRRIRKKYNPIEITLDNREMVFGKIKRMLAF